MGGPLCPDVQSSHSTHSWQPECSSKAQIRLGLLPSLTALVSLRFKGRMCTPCPVGNPWAFPSESLWSPDWASFGSSDGHVLLPFPLGAHAAVPFLTVKAKSCYGLLPPPPWPWSCPFPPLRLSFVGFLYGCVPRNSSSSWKRVGLHWFLDEFINEVLAAVKIIPENAFRRRPVSGRTRCFIAGFPLLTVLAYKGHLWLLWPGASVVCHRYHISD